MTSFLEYLEQNIAMKPNSGIKANNIRDNCHEIKNMSISEPINYKKLLNNSEILVLAVDQTTLVSEPILDNNSPVFLESKNSMSLYNILLNKSFLNAAITRSDNKLKHNPLKKLKIA